MGVVEVLTMHEDQRNAQKGESFLGVPHIYKKVVGSVSIFEGNETY